MPSYYTSVRMYVTLSARGVVADSLVAQFSSLARLKDEFL